MISVSLDSDVASEYFEDATSIGSFHAVANGIIGGLLQEIQELLLELHPTMNLGCSQLQQAQLIETSLVMSHLVTRKLSRYITYYRTLSFLLYENMCHF